ncbi:MAG: hypothetical protein AAFR81_13365 [Chloroflexota bacterium]
MLTHTERVRSNVHKHLRNCRGFTILRGENITVPNALKNQKVLGYYANSDDSKIFITYSGLFLYPSEVFISYFHIRTIKVDLSTKTKNEVEAIQIDYIDGQRKYLLVKDRTTEYKFNDLWAVFGFLRGINKKCLKQKTG